MKRECGSKIVILATEIFSSHGGIQRFLRSVLQALGEIQRRRGYEIEVVSMNDSADDRGRLRGLGLDGKFIGAERSTIRFLCGALESVRNTRILIASHINYSGLAYVITALRRRTECWVITYGVELSREESPTLWRFLKRSDLVITISAFTRRLLVESGVDGSKVEICYPTVDAERFRPGGPAAAFRRHFDLDDSRLVLSVGRMDRGDYYKGHDILIEAMPLVLELCGDVKLLLVGSGDDLPRLKHLARVLGLKGTVVFLGSLSEEDLIACYQTCDVFALISQNEGFGIVCLEALACGKPVITGNRDAAKEVVLDGELGLLVDPERPEEVGQAIVRVLERRAPPKLFDPTFLRGRALEKFGYERFVVRLDRLLLHRDPVERTRVGEGTH